MKEFLKKLGCSERESILYFTLLKNGELTVLELSRLVDIKRSSIYPLLKSLVDKRIVKEIKRGARKKYASNSPLNLKSVIKERLNEAISLEDLYSAAVNEYYSITSLDKGISEKTVLVYRGMKKFKEVCDRSLEFADGEILFLSDIDDWYQVYSRVYDNKHYIPTRIESKIELKLLVKETSLSKELRDKDSKVLRVTKFLPGDSKIDSTFMIYGNEVAMMTTKAPYTSVVIRNSTLVVTMKELFWFVWAMSR